jgi:uncharacterized protein YjdB
MMFTRKLAVALVAILALNSCKVPSRLELAEQAARVVISPSQIVVPANQDADLYAVALDAAGDTTSTGMLWTATGGSITETSLGGGMHLGRYHAPDAPGQYKVKARANPGSVEDSASVTVSTVSVASLTMSPPTAGILVGATQQFTATPKDSAGNPLTGRIITWVSSNTGVATVGTNGLATGVSAGTTTIVATSEGQSATATITVSPIPVASVTVSPSSASMTVGSATQLTASSTDASGAPLSGRVVTWTTSNAAVATVDANGLVAAVAAGSATITATSEGKNGTAAITVTPVPVATVTVSPASATIMIGGTQPLSAVTKDAAGNTLTGRVVTWSSSNTAVATVNSSGLVTAVAVGSATITATSEGKRGTAAITVTLVPVASVTVSPASASIGVGGTQQLSAVTKDSAGGTLTGRAVTWSSSNTAVATVNASGLVTGVSAGSATITATSEGKSGTAAITVIILPVATVTVSPASATVVIGGTQQLSAVTRDSTGNTLTGRVVTWSSSNTAVAIVDANGLVTAVAEGSATITATSEGKNGTAAITVTLMPVASVTVSPASASVRVGNTQQLSAVTKDAAGNTLTGRVVTWSSSNTAVATVNSSGLVTAVAVGSATITATSEGKSGTAAITVTPVPVATVTVSPASASIRVGSTQQLSAVTKDSAGNTLTGRVVTWASSNTAVATVSSSGLVTGKVAGSATITATSEGKNGTAAITVTVAPVATVTVSPATATIVVTGTQQLSAVTRDSAGNTLTGRVVTWGSSNTAIATMSGTGLVSGVAVGSVTITATSEGKSGSAAVTVQPQPTVSGDTITLQIVRMDGGSGSALVSSGIPLPKGKLTASNIAHVVLLVAGVERAIHVEALAGTWPDGSIRSLLVQFPYTVSTGNPIAALLVMGPSVTRSTTDLPKTTVTGNIPAAAALPTSPTYLVSTEVVGQTITRAASPATPAVFPNWENDFVTYGDQHWATEAGDWTYNYYDRVLIWYAWWVRTGNPEYWRRAAIDAVAYREQSLVPDNYIEQPNQAQLEGLALHYLLTGDEASRYAVARVAEIFADIWTPVLDCTACSGGGQYVEGRIQARTLQSHYLSWMIDAVGDSPRNWLNLMATDVTNILSTQGADGSYRFAEWEGSHSNYMTGLMHDMLIKYYTYVQADARIPPAIKKTLDWMWSTQWVSSAQAFKYVSENMSTGTTAPAPDLNLLIVTGYAWYYMYSGDATYKTTADAIFAGGVNGAYLTGYKQFNQNYTSAYRYLFYRQ